jgi:hypothetical protein
MPEKKRISNTEEQRRKNIMKQFQPSTTVPYTCSETFNSSI